MADNFTRQWDYPSGLKWLTTSTVHQKHIKLVRFFASFQRFKGIKLYFFSFSLLDIHSQKFQTNENKNWTGLKQKKNKKQKQKKNKTKKCNTFMTGKKIVYLIILWFALVFTIIYLIYNNYCVNKQMLEYDWYCTALSMT